MYTLEEVEKENVRGMCNMCSEHEAVRVVFGCFICEWCMDIYNERFKAELESLEA